jgi:hypothetical protein
MASGTTLSGALSVSEDECYTYSFFGPQCGDLERSDCEDMCQTCEAAVIDLLYNGTASVFGRITSPIRTACAAYTESELGRKILFYDSELASGRSFSMALGVSEDECYSYSFFGPRCGDLERSDCGDMCQTCEAAVIDLVYNQTASVFDRITSPIRTACAAHTESELGRKILFYDSELASGSSFSKALGVSEDECYSYSFFGIRCGDLDRSDCEDMCQTCESAVIDLVYNGTSSVFGRITSPIRTACAAYTESELGRKILFYDSTLASGSTLSMALGVSEDECYSYSFFGPRCGDLDRSVCQDMCQTCESAIIHVVYGD